MAKEDVFNKILLGDIVSIEHTITTADIESFCELSGDNNPLHMDTDYSAQTHFGKRVAHGMLSASFISTIIGTKLPGKGALWQSLNIQFLAPVFINDVIIVTATVTHKSESQRVLVLDVAVNNQNEKSVIKGTASVKVLPPPVEKQIRLRKMKKQDLGIAIVTGASHGIGAEISIQLALDGYSVVINYNKSKDSASSVKKRIEELGGSAIIVQADVSNRDSVKEMVSSALKYGPRISLLVNNACSEIVPKIFSELSWHDIESHLNTQLKGAFNLCKEVIPFFEEQGDGNIINISTIYLDDTPPIELYDYIIAKSGLLALSRSLAVEYGPRGIRVNCVAPGMTETKLIANVPERSKLLVEATAPLRRLARPEDIAKAVSFLASDGASYLTGEVVRVCGGQRMI